MKKLSIALSAIGLALVATSSLAATPEEAMNKAGCVACHARTRNW